MERLHGTISNMSSTSLAELALQSKSKKSRRGKEFTGYETVASSSDTLHMSSTEETGSAEASVVAADTDSNIRTVIAEAHRIK